jgi:hypothetical protein
MRTNFAGSPELFLSPQGLNLRATAKGCGDDLQRFRRQQFDRVDKFINGDFMLIHCHQERTRCSAISVRALEHMFVL